METELPEPECPVCGEPLEDVNAGGLVQCSFCLKWVTPEYPEGE